MQDEKSKKSRYRLYVDESGDHTFRNLDNPSCRFLGVLGVWFRQQDDYTRFADALESLKRDIFETRPDELVVLHRSDIVYRKGAFSALRDSQVRRRFDERLIQVIRDANFRVCCVIIDKRRHLEQYPDPFHPYHYCLAAMLDRYSGWLNYKNATGDVMAESRGREEDRQLKQAYQRVYESGTLMYDHRHHQRALTSHELKLKRKDANIPGLQLADLLAHPIKQACLLEANLTGRPQREFAKEIVRAVEPKFNRNEWRDRISGYGKVFLPRLHQKGG